LASRKVRGQPIMRGSSRLRTLSPLRCMPRMSSSRPFSLYLGPFSYE
jgi:hypothetical protein